MIAVVPVTGQVHLYPDGEVPLFPATGAVTVRLTTGEDYVGSVTFAIDGDGINTRATEATFLLSGAYLRVMGDAMFDVPDRTLCQQVMEEL